MSTHQAPHAGSFEQSLFCQRLDELAQQQPDNTRLTNLSTATRRLLESAAAISKQIARHLPQFTSHDEVHLWNVLSFMEELAGGAEGIALLDAGDCGMAVWAAFIHDLGMVLESEELAALDAADKYDSSEEISPSLTSMSDARVQAWRAYRDGHEHWNTVRVDPHSDVNRMRLGIIRAAFIRDSHARQDSYSGHCRIADWLEFLMQGDLLLQQALEDYAVADRLVRVAVSHNQDIHWLPRQLSTQLGVDDPNAESMGPDLGTIHWTWIGWLLRLADVFDCDRSRTPRVLFDHGGITDARSKTEWQKHLAIPTPPQWSAGADWQTLLFTCQLCPSPIVEKAIHQVIGGMNDEISKVRAAWNAVPDRTQKPVLTLPSAAEVEIKKRKGNYLYQDMEFRLDRDAVVELLMGESLYGGPELALRELVQNALDAVHLRDQRNRLATALEKAGGTERARQPHQHWGGQKPEVTITWGEEDGRRFVRVHDTGVGMTVSTMRRFLTQIGKSYYKSDDFRAELELMRRNGILCSAISQFGIGFLSVFMLADHVTIHTRPVAAGDTVPPPNQPEFQETARFPFRAQIHGPHGLLIFYPDQSVSLPGTSVTLWLKEQFVLPAWNRRLLLGRLKKEFYQQNLPQHLEEVLKQEAESVEPGKQLLDPAFEIGRFIVWPLYPVRLAADQSDSVILNDSFHDRELLPLDREKLMQQATKWEIDLPEIDSTDWQACDWVDEHRTPHGMEGTGSRIRLIGPQPCAEDAPVQPADWDEASDILPSGHARLLLGSLTEAQLPRAMKRYQCLVNGVRIVPGFVPASQERDCKLSAIIEELSVLPGEGGWVWVDLRGAAMPRLRADRAAPVVSQAGSLDLNGVMHRWLHTWPEHLPNWITTLTNCPEFRRPLPVDDQGPWLLGIPGVSPSSLPRMLKQEAAILNRAQRAVPGGEQRVTGRDPELSERLGHGSWVRRRLALRLAFSDGFPLDLADDLADALFLASPEVVADFANTSDFARALDRKLDARDMAWGRAPTHGLDLARSNQRYVSVLIDGIKSHLASEGFWPDLANSHPALGVAGLSIQLNDLVLVGPSHAASRNPLPQFPRWTQPYDITFPYTAFASPAMHRRFPDWTTDRSIRILCVLPFLLGQEPSAEWRDLLRNRRPFDSLMLFMPSRSKWKWLFADHSVEEWADGSSSALWDLRNGNVLYADGIHTKASLQKKGQPLREWLGIPDSE